MTVSAQHKGSAGTVYKGFDGAFLKKENVQRSAEQPKKSDASGRLRLAIANPTFQGHGAIYGAVRVKSGCRPDMVAGVRKPWTA
ncbi:hypothetical protein [Methylicorpusculum sp.]|uniref:hypothetical protein n=1 Tax=Methylicorpusculum sp. TaxID=2713644 RepID=UPI00271D0B59|nr:hypothetical protein [Methylicorpusculum sp.]MDO8844484.1 hypothetical protein [Methylicorpusculum sp.]